MLVLQNIAASITCVALALSLFVLTSGSRLMFVVGALLAIASVVAGIVSVTGTSVPHKEKGILLVPTAINIVSVIGVLMFIESATMRFLLIAVTTAMHAAYVSHAFFYLHVPTRYAPHALESVSSFLHSMSIFACTATTFGLGLFTEIPFPLLMIPCVIVAAAISLHALWMSKIPLVRAKRLAAIGTLIFAQAVAACALLPTSLFVNAAVVTLIMYVLHFHFRVVPTDPHFKRTAHKATLLASSLVAVLLISAPWR